MDLEESSLGPLIERVCAECGTKLSRNEIEASLEAAGPFLCAVHAAEDVPVAEEDPAAG